MNIDHARLCASPEWAAYLQTEVLPVVTAPVELGKDMLEIGPGPGAATDWLRHRVQRLTALETDEAAAATLAGRYAGPADAASPAGPAQAASPADHPAGSVRVTAGDATRLGYPDCSFDSVGSFTMLHHVPTAAAQHQILAEALRVLRPGGVLVGSDSLADNDLHHFHEGDTYNPVDPATLLVWLRALGFAAVTVTVDEILMFRARKPSPGDDRAQCEAPDTPCRGEGGAA